MNTYVRSLMYSYIKNKEKDSNRFLNQIVLWIKSLLYTFKYISLYLLIKTNHNPLVTYSIIKSTNEIMFNLKITKRLSCPRVGAV